MSWLSERSNFRHNRIELRKLVSDVGRKKLNGKNASLPDGVSEHRCYNVNIFNNDPISMK
ncbi:unnamed protein product, partial [Nesidiocoris tenuis]